ncbi:hypothetical protein CP118TE_30460 (plasmid) [Clostridium perfringens E]|uniref:Uncharacterized protein n=1 Tax=Clostridium perfringens TaxID=1502 RepID=F7J0A6_CLOPF|nr:conserved hypothetical protein [Clostridium perfringens]BDC03337.1 hypothetical protein CP118TE_30460 [Clostridium perfringens E]
MWLRKSSKIIIRRKYTIFFEVINSYFYYSIVDNIFELSFYETIQCSKEFKFYNKTYSRLKFLINSNPNENLYRNLLE